MPVILLFSSSRVTPASFHSASEIFGTSAGSSGQLVDLLDQSRQPSVVQMDSITGELPVSSFRPLVGNESRPKDDVVTTGKQLVPSVSVDDSQTSPTIAFAGDDADLAVHRT